MHDKLTFSVIHKENSKYSLRIVQGLVNPVRHLRYWQRGSLPVTFLFVLNILNGPEELMLLTEVSDIAQEVLPSPTAFFAVAVFCSPISVL